MSRQQKTFLALLACVAIAFGLTLLLGRGSDGGVRSPPWLAWVGEQLLDSGSLSMRQTSAPCKKGEVFLLFEGEVCTVDIGASKVPVRKAQLRLDEGARVVFELTQKGTIPQRRELRAGGEPVALQVFDKPAQVLLRCLAGGGEQGRRRCELSITPLP